MQVKLVVTSEDNPSCQDLYNFSQEVITIGRDRSSLLYLADPKRIVGRSHAKLERKGDVVHLIDVGSRNFTFLKGKKIDAEKPYVLKPGDQFKIGDFIVKFEGLIKEPAELEPIDKTIVDQTFPNPFIDDAKELAKILKQIYDKYDAGVPSRRNEELNQTLSEQLGEIKPTDAATLISAQLKPSMAVPVAPEPFPAEGGALLMTDRIRFLCDVLLTAFVKFIKAPWNFKEAFIGITKIKSRSFSVHSSTLQEVREFLLSGHISDYDFKNRIAILKKEADEAMVHQVALMDGYKASVNEGSRHLLEHFNPDALKKILDKQSIKLGRIEIPYRYLPIFYHWKLLQLYQQKYVALIQEDRGIFENKMFRPGFINAYLERLSSAQSEEPGSKQQLDF